MWGTFMSQELWEPVQVSEGLRGEKDPWGVPMVPSWHEGTVVAASSNYLVVVYLKGWPLHALVSDWAWALVSFKDGRKAE